MVKKAPARGATDAVIDAVIEGVVKHAWPDALDLHPWQRQGGAPEEGMLRVNLSRGKELAVNAVVRFSTPDLARWPDPACSYQWSCTGARPVKPITHAALGAIATARTRPRTYANRILGDLVLDRRHGWYAGERTYAGRTYALRISVTDPDHAGRSARELSAGAGAILAAETRLPALHARIVARLYPQWVDRWRQRQRHTAESFAKILQPVSLHAAGAVTVLRYRAGTLFGRHEIEVQVKGGTIRACGVV